MHKQQCLKEQCELPFIQLSDDDERILFDLSVSLKFGNSQTVFQSCQALQTMYFFDFPPEIFLQRTDILKSLLDLLEGGQVLQNQNVPLQLKRSQEFQVIQIVQQSNNGCKPSIVGAENDFENEDKNFIDPYIKLTYPCNRLSRWEGPITQSDNQESQKINLNYRTQTLRQNQQSGSINSLSCRAVLGQILTKSIFLLQDTENISIYIQLIQEALQSLEQIYNVKTNSEFSELLHLCLFAFDKVCDFYRDRLYEDVLIQPILTLLLKFLFYLNLIPFSNLEISQACQSHEQLVSTQTHLLNQRFKQPITQALIQNTENLQRVLRRALFRSHFPEDSVIKQIDDCQQFQYQNQIKVVLQFFQLCDNYFQNENQQACNMLRNVQKSFFKGQESFANFIRVSQFRIDQNLIENKSGSELVCFTKSKDEFYNAIKLLEDLSQCLELKMEFPFENVIIDVIQYGSLLVETKEDDFNDIKDEQLLRIERIVQTFIAYPIPEIRERILRKFYQKLRIINPQDQKPKSVNNNRFVAKFILRKGILNHLVNGILINQEISTKEESKLQMSIGHLIVKILIISFNELQGYSSTENPQLVALPQLQQLNQFLLTFQCLLTQYPELLALIELIEEHSQKNCRYLRIIRDLFLSQEHKREFATNVLRASFSVDSQDEPIQDLLKCITDLRNPQLKVSSDLDLINSNYDYSSFGIIDIVNILQSSKQDYQIKKSSLEQLTMILFDVNGKRGKLLFDQHQGGVQDVFSFCLDEILAAFNSCKNYLKKKVQNLGKDQILFVNECLRFMFYSYIFFNSEEVIKQFFNKIKQMLNNKRLQRYDLDDNGIAIVPQFEQLLNALVFFMGCQILRENSLLLLYVQVYQQLWITTKVSKYQTSTGQLIKNITILIPDFCQHSIVQLIPFTVQAIRMPMKEELMLSEEQKMYILHRFQQDQIVSDKQIQLDQVASQLTNSIRIMKGQDYKQTLATGVQQWKNYLVSLNQMRSSLINSSTLQSLLELLKILPTKQEEYFQLGDYFAILTQILTSSKWFNNTDDCNYISESRQNIQEFIIRIIEGLKYHQIPYLEETGVAEVNQETNEVTPKSYLIFRFLELLISIIDADLMIYQTNLKNRGNSLMLKELLNQPTLFQYLIDMFNYLKTNLSIKKQILQLIFLALTKYGLRDSQLVGQISDMIVEQVSQLKMVFNQFQNASVIMISIRILIVLRQRRMLNLNQQDLAISQSASLSETYNTKMSQYKSFGWILRFLETRDSRIRVMTWDLLTQIFDYELFKAHPSLIFQVINTFLKNQELYCVKISGLKFLNKVCDALMVNCENTDSQDLDQTNDSQNQDQQLTVKSLLQTFNRQGLISQVHRILSQKDYPLQFLSLTLQLIHNLVQMDYKKALPVITQLDYWTFLVELLDIQVLTQIERQESRSLLKQMKTNYDGKMQYLNVNDPCESLDIVYMTINQILDLLFDAFKRDSQLAALLIKTTKLMDSVFQLIQSSIDQHRVDRSNQQFKLKNWGLLTVFIDKIVKILHVAMMHPQDYSVELISRFIFSRPISLNGQELPRNWIYFIEMFQIIQTCNQTFNFYDLKLALIRFISEFLVQTSQFSNNYLDELTQQISYKVIDGQPYSDFSEFSSYGQMLFNEFQNIFRALYSDEGSKESPLESENHKKDICLCISILQSSCQSAKSNSVNQGFLSKVIDICSDNCQALNQQQLVKYSGQGQSTIDKNRDKLFDQQLLKKIRYVKDISDVALCEREAIRMLSLIRNLFYDSQNLLTDLIFTQNADVKNESKIKSKQSKTKIVLQSLNDKLMSLFGQIIEELGIQKQFENLVSEALLSLITFSSQNVKFKNCSLQLIDVSTQSKKNSLIKIICDQIQKVFNFQSSSKLIRLMYTLLRTLSISGDIVKEIMKNRFIEEVTQKLIVQCKNQKDIKQFKIYLCHYLEFLSAFSSTEEGQKQILKINQVFDFSIFVLENMSLPLIQEQKLSEFEFQMTPLSNLVRQILLFIRNATIDSRQTKIYFLKNDDFLPNLMKIIQQDKIHPLIKAYAAAVLQSLVHKHQGIKAQINKSAILNDLQAIKTEYESQIGYNEYAKFQNINTYNFDNGKNDVVKVNYEYNSNYMIADKAHLVQQNKMMVKDTNKFIFQIISGVIILIQS